MNFAAGLGQVLARRRCARNGHLFVDSRSQPATQVCVRCRFRKPFEGLEAPPQGGAGL